ncbi:hypothetical protein CA3LBN_004352 [Candidozyma haemuli]|uniref:CAF1B/HIR1 beta-propeller domain-containing protein n=1 Tax=Candidozyma haemuli TaxID=45357 RepID=A0ABX8IBY3_9ASCO|nr:hypothetical protein CA3LBN_004352 [[Candida] haemuloni]
MPPRAQHRDPASDAESKSIPTSRSANKARNAVAVAAQQELLSKHIHSNGPHDKPRIDVLDFNTFDDTTLEKYNRKFGIECPAIQKIDEDILRSDIGKKTYTARNSTIHWHDENQPIYSADCQSRKDGQPARLATGGGDNNVRIWKVQHPEDPTNVRETTVNYLSTLRKHTQAVNATRFDQTGDYLATAGDDGLLIIWILAEEVIQDFGNQDDELKESWIVNKVFHTNSEVYDISWSPDSRFIAAGSTDNSIRIFDCQSGEKTLDWKGHGHYVQGISWDPREVPAITSSPSLLVKPSQSGVKTVSYEPQQETQANAPEAPLSVNGNNQSTHEGKIANLYHPESLQSFFRRLAFSPDGSLLLTPSGLLKEGSREEEDPEVVHHTVYVHTRAALSNPPVCYLSGFDKPAIAVRFSPILYKSDLDTSELVFDLPHKMIFAVATQNSVIVYDTEHFKPLGLSKNLHYSTITDITWSSDGNSIIITSAEGFCSIMLLSDGILGTPLQVQEKKNDGKSNGQMSRSTVIEINSDEGLTIGGNSTTKPTDNNASLVSAQSCAEARESESTTNQSSTPSQTSFLSQFVEPPIDESHHM